DPLGVGPGKLNGAHGGGIGRLDQDGNFDASFVSPFAPDSSINRVTLQADGKVLVGGSFRLAGSQDERQFARLAADGSLDAAFVPPTGSGVQMGGAIAMESDG